MSLTARSRCLKRRNIEYQRQEYLILLYNDRFLLWQYQYHPNTLVIKHVTFKEDKLNVHVIRDVHQDKDSKMPEASTLQLSCIAAVEEALT